MIIKESELENHPLFIDEPQIGNLVLDFQNYVNIIASTILFTKPPQLTVGIFGEWGTGKSTLMKNIQHILEKHGCHSVEFSAWQFGQEERHATYPLMLTILIRLLQKDDLRGKLESISKETQKKIIQVMRGLKFSGKAELPYVGEITLDADIEKMLEKYKDRVEQFVDSNKPLMMAGIDLIKEILEKHIDGPEQNKDLKLLVFIDDLDRCTPEKTTEILESIKVFFNITGIIFVLGLNDEIVKLAIEKKYEHFKPKFNGDDYMKKIIQLPIRIPEWKSKDIEKYIDSLLEKYNDVKFKHMFEKEKKIIAEGVESNPREIKRFLNMFIITYLILSEKNKLDEKELLIVLALRMRWNWFFNAIFTIDHFLNNVQSIILKKEFVPEKGSVEEKVKEVKPLVEFLEQYKESIFQIKDWDKYRRAITTINENEHIITCKNCNTKIKSPIQGDINSIHSIPGSIITNCPKCGKNVDVLYD